MTLFEIKFVTLIFWEQPQNVFLSGAVSGGPKLPAAEPSLAVQVRTVEPGPDLDYLLRGPRVNEH